MKGAIARGSAVSKLVRRPRLAEGHNHSAARIRSDAGRAVGAHPACDRKGQNTGLCSNVTREPREALALAMTIDGEDSCHGAVCARGNSPRDESEPVASSLSPIRRRATRSHGENHRLAIRPHLDSDARWDPLAPR